MRSNVTGFICVSLLAIQWNLFSNGLVGVYSLKTHALVSIDDVDKIFAEVVYLENYILQGL